MDEMNIKTCEKCGAKWINGQLFWATGAKGNDLDLAGLVCNNLPTGEEAKCINSSRGEDGGETWEYRRGFIEGATKELERVQTKQDD